MLTGEAQNPGAGIAPADGRGSLDLSYDIEIEESENDLIESELAELKDESIQSSLGEKVAKTLSLTDELLSGPNREKLTSISEYLFKEMRLRDPDDVVAAVIKLADMANLQTALPEGVLDGIYKMLQNQRMLKAVSNTNEHHARQGYFA
jgi:hypothetical protein